MRKPITGIALAGLALAAALAHPAEARAQFRFGRGGFNRSPAFSQAGVYGQHMRSIGFSRSPGAVIGSIGRLNEMYGGGYGGGGGVTLDAGAASEIIKAQSEAIKAAEKAKQDKKDRQKQVFDELQLERARNLRRAREWEREDLVRRSREDPDRPTIANGWALNDLFLEIVKVQRETGLRGPEIPVEGAALRRVNYTGAAASGGFGPFKAGKPLEWPGVLATAAFQDERARVDAAVAPALSEVAAGGKDVREMKAVQELSRAVAAMRDQLKELRDDVPGADYLKALEFLLQLENSAAALVQKNASQLLSGALTATGSTVADWVEDMANKGLKVAPAAPGDEPAYAALYRALHSYTEGLNQMAAR